MNSALDAILVEAAAAKGEEDLKQAAQRLEAHLEGEQQDKVEWVYEATPFQSAVLSTLVLYLTRASSLHRLSVNWSDRWAYFLATRNIRVMRDIPNLRIEWARAMLVMRRTIPSWNDDDFLRAAACLSKNLDPPFHELDYTPHERTLWRLCMYLRSGGGKAWRLQDPVPGALVLRASACLVAAGYPPPDWYVRVTSCVPEDLEMVVSAIAGLEANMAGAYLTHSKFSEASEEVHRAMRFHVLYSEKALSRRTAIGGRARRFAPRWACPQTGWVMDVIEDINLVVREVKVIEHQAKLLADRVDETGTRSVTGLPIDVEVWLTLLTASRLAVHNLGEVAAARGFAVIADEMRVHRARIQDTLETMGYGFPSLPSYSSRTRLPVPTDLTPREIFAKQNALEEDLPSVLMDSVEPVRVFVDNLMTAASNLDLNEAIAQRLARLEIEHRIRTK